MHHVINHTENSGAEAADELVECLGVAGLGLLHQVQLRDIGLSRSRFRVHLLTGMLPDSFNGYRLP